MNAQKEKGEILRLYIYHLRRYPGEVAMVLRGLFILVKVVKFYRRIWFWLKTIG